mmetsp:Transcript_24301/g.61181  ORF Transcript_24301/g.61181 Transcript_24301/m.61181 type:complete len:105 (-) Transcript_24301:78-392(-)
MDRTENYRQMAKSQDYFLSNFILPMYDAWLKHSEFNGMVNDFSLVLQRNISSWALLHAEPNLEDYEATKSSTPVRKIAKSMPRKSLSACSLRSQEQVERMYGLK